MWAAQKWFPALFRFWWLRKRWAVSLVGGESTFSTGAVSIGGKLTRFSEKWCVTLKSDWPHAARLGEGGKRSRRMKIVPLEMMRRQASQLGCFSLKMTPVLIRDVSRLRRKAWRWKSSGSWSWEAKLPFFLNLSYIILIKVEDKKLPLPCTSSVAKQALRRQNSWQISCSAVEISLLSFVHFQLLVISVEFDDPIYRQDCCGLILIWEKLEFQGFQGFWRR